MPNFVKRRVGESAQQEEVRENAIQLEGTLVDVAVSYLQANPHQHRTIFNPRRINELAASMRANGLLQPISIAEYEETGETRIAAGERRWRAAKQLGWKTIKAIHLGVRDALWFRKIALVENINREDLHLYEKIKGYLDLIEVLEAEHPDRRVTLEELANEVNESKGNISKYLKIARHSDLMTELKEGAEQLSREGVAEDEEQQAEKPSLREYYNRILEAERAKKPSKQVQTTTSASPDEYSNTHVPQEEYSSSGGQVPDDDSYSDEDFEEGADYDRRPTKRHAQKLVKGNTETRASTSGYSSQQSDKTVVHQPSGTIPFVFGGQHQYISVVQIAEMMAAINTGFLSSEALEIATNTAPYDAQELLEQWEQLGMTIKGKLASRLTK